MTSAGRAAANLATLANALLGVGAIVYTIAGNKLWAFLLIGCGIGFDGLDGILSRRAGLAPSTLGRVLDSLADAVTFGVAPGVLVAVQTAHASLWVGWASWTLLAGAVVTALALARLGYFTWRGWRVPNFVGASTPQNALALILLLLFFDVPPFAGTRPVVVVVGAVLLAVLMVAPVPYPKLRRGAKLRSVMVFTAAMLAVSLVPIQFHLATGTLFYVISEAAAVLAAVGMATFYVLGPWSVRTGTGPGSGPEVSHA
jgi:CDP-diacylglycerol--serine O-phosphatidyltransferase